VVGAWSETGDRTLPVCFRHLKNTYCLQIAEILLVG